MVPRVLIVEFFDVVSIDVCDHPSYDFFCCLFLGEVGISLLFCFSLQLEDLVFGEFFLFQGLEAWVYAWRLFQQVDGGVLVICGYALLLFLEDEVHVSELSSQFVAFDSSCHSAQFHREVLDCQDG